MEEKIRKLTPLDIEQYNQLLRYAFMVTDRTLFEYGWNDENIRHSKFPVLERANVLGWFDEEMLVSLFAAYPLKMNIHGSIYDIGFITSVATYPEYSGKGLMSKLMKKGLSDMKIAGQNFSLLCPYSIPLYRHRGFEIVSDKMSFRVKDSQIPQNIHAKGYVRRVEYDSKDLKTLHQRFAELTHGCIFRSELAWEEYRRWDPDDTIVAIYYNEAGEPLGYMVYILIDEIMNIKEMIYLNMEGRMGLWKYIGAHISMINEVKGDNYTNESLAFWLEDSEIIEMLCPYVMGRIIDCESFLCQYNWVDIKRQDSISFVVEDNLLEWNNNCFTIEFLPNEKPKLSSCICEKIVKLSIGTLTAMLLGYKLPSYLYTIEQLDTKKEIVALLDNIIPKGKPYISDYM